MSEEIAIKVDHVSKDFVLPHNKVNSVKGLFMSLASNRNKTEETQHALKDISFEIKKGEFFGIVGRNGSGKSTMLKILANIYQPTKGGIQTTGKLVPFIELGVGFNPELTGRENVFLNGAMLGFSEKEVEAMYKDIVEFAELERFMDQKLKNYSSGMQVRLAFSMATRAEADILLVDEVLAVGDADFQRKCFDYFKKLKKDKKTVVFVSHDMTAVREYCDRAVMIEKSEVISTGSADEVASKYTKMFLQETKALKDGQESVDDMRWGDETLIFSSPTIEELDSKKIIFSATVTAERDCADPSFGFSLHNSMGESLLGTNTVLQKYPTKPFVKGQKSLVTWQLPNILAEGDYTVSLAALYNGGLTPADWWEESLTFSIKKEIRTPYKVQPDVQVTVEKIGGVKN
ncbi:MAG TPA: ABC transporter ATP-binding protein [Candidatus Saccharimonadales bacterium]